MSDRELLEMAAKAAGYDGVRPATFGTDCWMALVEGDWQPWNPLTEDGDALRLAVKLGEKYPAMVVGIFNRAAFPHASASVVHRDGAETYVEQDVGDDVAAATRLAIVLVAAEIGRTQ